MLQWILFLFHAETIVNVPRSRDSFCYWIPEKINSKSNTGKLFVITLVNIFIKGSRYFSNELGM